MEKVSKFDKVYKILKISEKSSNSTMLVNI